VEEGGDYGPWLGFGSAENQNDCSEDEHRAVKNQWGLGEMIALFAVSGRNAGRWLRRLRAQILARLPRDSGIAVRMVWE
jgi:glycine cleavage system aminomethyltransferase T